MNSKPATDIPFERLSGSVDQVTFHGEESGLCALRVKVKGGRNLVTVIDSAASNILGKYLFRMPIQHHIYRV